MSNELNSPIFALSAADKEEALKAIANGIQQLTWQKDYVQYQYDALPPLPDDAPTELTQERAKRRVHIDAMEQKIEEQVTFYNFCKSKI